MTNERKICYDNKTLTINNVLFYYILYWNGKNVIDPDIFEQEVKKEPLSNKKHKPQSPALFAFHNVPTA